MTFTHLTAVLIIWFSDGSHTVSTHRIEDCYAIEAAINNEEGADTSMTDNLYFPGENTTANSALCVDPFPADGSGEEF